MKVFHTFREAEAFAGELMVSGFQSVTPIARMFGEEWVELYEDDGNQWDEYAVRVGDCPNPGGPYA